MPRPASLINRAREERVTPRHGRSNRRANEGIRQGGIKFRRGLNEIMCNRRFSYGGKLSLKFHLNGKRERWNGS